MLKPLKIPTFDIPNMGINANYTLFFTYIYIYICIRLHRSQYIHIRLTKQYLIYFLFVINLNITLSLRPTSKIYMSSSIHHDAHNS